MNSFKERLAELRAKLFARSHPSLLSEAHLIFNQAKRTEPQAAQEALLLIAEVYEKQGAHRIATQYRIRGERYNQMQAQARERINDPRKLDEDLRDKLLHILIQGPKDKHELIEMLYGRELDFQKAEARFWHTLHRVRRRLPGAITLSNGKYRVSDAYRVAARLTSPMRERNRATLAAPSRSTGRNSA